MAKKRDNHHFIDEEKRLFILKNNGQKSPGKK